MQVICFTSGAQLLKNAEVGLSYYEAEVDDYIPVPCRLELDPAGSLLVTAVSFALPVCVLALSWRIHGCTLLQACHNDARQALISLYSLGRCNTL